MATASSRWSILDIIAPLPPPSQQPPPLTAYGDDDDDGAFQRNQTPSSDELDDVPISLREQMGLREVDAESLIAPILSRTQSSVLYAAATTPSHSPSRSVSPSSEEDEAVGGVRNVHCTDAVGARAKVAEYRVPPAERRPPVSGLQTPLDHHHHHHDNNKKHSHKNPLPFSLPSFQLPSLPNVTLPSFVSSGHTETVAEKYKRRRSKTMQQPRTSSSVFSTQRSSTFFGRQFPRDFVGAIQSSYSSGLRPAPPPQLLRKSSSVSSLTRLSLSRVVTDGSTTSSLGDDTKFLHIHSMTNSRFKAIKDNIIAGLPTMPQLPHLQQHFANMNPFADTTENLPTSIMPRSPEMEALDNVAGDVVILGGYRGSILRETATGRRAWIPLKVGFNLRKVDLEVGLEPEDEERAAEKIRSDGMLKSISAVDISRRLIRRLRNGAEARDRRVHDWGYDWRLSPALITKQLIAFLETLPSNQKVEGEDVTARRKGKGALVIAHSLGGLIVRSAINQRPELFSGVIFAGTPMHCINILGPLKNGDSVLFNSKVFTAQVNFTLRTSYAFLPEDGHCFIDKTTGKTLPVNFYDINTWRTYGLSPCVSDIPQPPPHPIPARLTALRPLNSLSSEREKGPVAPLPGSQLNTSSAPEAFTIPKSRAIPYLTRTLAATLDFRRGLAFCLDLEHRYPPMAVLYSKTTPTVRGAKVDGREGIKRSDAYDELVFGAGDGVCLARAAMLPAGYRCARKVAVDRGHVSLLGELEGVGKCVEALVKERGW